MNKQLLVDPISLHTSSLTLLEGKDARANNGRLRLKGKLHEAEVKNGNGRVYPREVLEREVKNFIEGPIKSNTAMGELDHNNNMVINLNNVSHIIKELWWEGNSLMGIIELLQTPAGKIAEAIISSGIPLGISSRGMGSIQQIGESVEVQDDFSLLTWDLVSTPSTPNAYVNLTEGKSLDINKLNKYTNINKLITEIICNHTGVCPLC